MMMQRDKCRIKFNKPTHFGASMLELSKVSTYNFYYNYIKNKCDEKTVLLFTDIDSFMYETEAENDYENFTITKHYLISANIQKI